MWNPASLPCFMHLKFCIARSDAGLCRLSGPPTAVGLPEEMVKDGNMRATLPVCTICPGSMGLQFAKPRDALLPHCSIPSGPLVCCSGGVWETSCGVFQGP